MEIDAIDGLVALGLVSNEQAAAAAGIVDADVGRLGRLALVGVDVGALMPTLSAISRVPLATAEQLNATAAPNLPPAAQATLRALPACPVQRADGGFDVVLSDPKVRAQIAPVLGPMFRAFLAPEEHVRALAARLLTAAAPAPTAAPSKADVQAQAPTLPRAPSVASNEMAAFVEGPRARTAGLSGAALAAALAEPVDLDDAEKRRILDLDARLETATPAELLGVSPSASADEIKERYYQLSRAFHPDAHFRKKLGSYKARIQRVFRGLKKACDTMVAQAEERDHLDLELPSAGGLAPSGGPPTPATAFPARPNTVAPGVARASLPEPVMPSAALELDGPVRGAAVAASAAGAPRPRTGTVARPPKAASRGLDRRLLIGAAAVMAVLLIAVVASVAMRHTDKPTEIASTDPATRQAQLVERARSESVIGNHAEAIAFATEAIKLAPSSPAAARALAVRGRSSIDNGDRAEGFADLEEAIRRLPSGDAIRSEAEAALKRARP